ncbi:unnamed protein product, partial [Phaeothamnion confervicola]
MASLSTLESSLPSKKRQGDDQSGATGSSSGRRAAPPINKLWPDKYQPTTAAELAVHPKKIEEVRRWLLEAATGDGGG